jgi:muramoyltetrapeptide carboxypeptidase
MLRKAGFSVRLGAHALDRRGYLAGDDDSRLEDLHTMFRDPDVRAIFCTRGGYGTLRLLHRIDYDLVRQSPKILVGYSDVTALLLAVHVRAGLVTFHGPMVREMAGGDEANLPFLFDILGGQPGREIPLTGTSIFFPGEVEARLLGGNLSLLCHLIGTPYFPDLRGALLFVEERGEPLYRIDRMFTHLALSGHLDGVAGLLGGEFADCGPMQDLEGFFEDLASRLRIPTVLGLPAGHGRKNLTLPMGAPVRLSTDGRSLFLSGPAVRPNGAKARRPQNRRRKGML